MRITDLEAYTVAVPFTAPIFSAYGVSYPARVRTFIRVHTDAGLTGVGEAGVSATHHVAHDAQVQRFRHEIGPRIEGADPFDYRALLLRLGHSPESIAVEYWPAGISWGRPQACRSIACWAATAPVTVSPSRPTRSSAARTRPGVARSMRTTLSPTCRS
ncbi:MAG: hypothetical protein R2854_26645 [Caldilineaceae bacterium]